MAKTDILFGLRGVCLIAVVFCGILQIALSDSVICGNAINDALTLMCKKGFNTYRTKRNFPLEDNFDNTDVDNFAFDLDRLPFWTSLTDNSLTKLRRRRDGVYYECCLKPCTKAELMTFCRK